VNTPGPELVLPLWRVLAALAVVLALLGGLAWLIRRGVLTRRATGALAIESSLPLGDRRSLVVLTVEGRRLLLGLAPGQISMVTELQPRQSFDDALARAGAGPRSAAS
jgi:flagellar protein FliO/FliZ